MSSLLRNVVRAYVRHSPISRGKGGLVYGLRKYLSAPNERVTTVTDFGSTMELDLSDAVQRSIYFFGSYEPELCAFLEAVVTPGAFFVDCGANCGQFTLLAAARGASVLAVEPEPNNWQDLKRNIAANGFNDRVEVVNACLGDQEGAVSFYVNASEFPNINRGAHSLKPHSDWPSREIRVPMVTLDSLLADRKPTLIKFDIEGAELLALRGAQETLARNSPILVLEASEFAARYLGYSTVELKEWLIAHDYRLGHLSTDGVAYDVDPKAVEASSTLVASRPGSDEESMLTSIRLGTKRL